MAAIVGRRSLPLLIEADLDGTVLQLKENLQELLGVSAGIQALSFNGQNLQDDHVLGTYGIVERSRIQLLFPFLLLPATAFQPQPVVLPAEIMVEVGGSVRGEAGPFTAMFSPMDNAKIAIEVNAQDMLRSLAEELQKLGQELRRLGGGNCLFVHKNRVMQPDKSFEWHNIEDGDTIEVVPRHTD